MFISVFKKAGHTVETQTANCIKRLLLFLYSFGISSRSRSFLCDERTKRDWLVYFFGVLGMLFTLVPVILFPFLYIFDDKGVTLFFLLLHKEHYLWSNITKIYITSFTTRSFTDVFQLCGMCENKKRFYMQGQITKTLRTKHLLEKYWNGKIT